MNNIETRVLDWCRQNSMFNNGDLVLCGVSGGIDSMAMLIILNKLSKMLGINVEVAHFNHCIRGEESDRDAEFVKKYCLDNSIPFHYGDGDVPGYAASTGMGTEEAARELRYGFFDGIVPVTKDYKAIKIATAHHADDNLETVLMKIIRGTGMNGLCGIPPIRGNIVRPVLCITRDELKVYLENIQVEHVEDSTNHTDDYMRNRIRHNILPLMKAENSEVCTNLVQTCFILRKEKQKLDDDAQRIVEAAETMGQKHSYELGILKQGGGLIVERLAATLLEKEEIKGISQKTIQAVAKLINSDSTGSKHVNCRNGIVASTDYNKLIFHKVVSLDEVWGESKIKEETLGYGVHTISSKNGLLVSENQRDIPKEYNKKTTLIINKSKISGNLRVRSKHDSDTIRLNCGTKSLSKLFNEKMIPNRDRINIPVIVDDTGVVGVIGVGVSLDYLADKNCETVEIREYIK